MASIKATYGQTFRKFNIASNTTWVEFESQLHDLFNIPKETSISISYVDEDDDVITLSTDSELQQILSDQESFGTNVKFNVYTSENSDNNGWILENAEEKDDSVTTLSDDETTSNKDEGIVAYAIGEPSETENKENKEDTEDTENVEVKEVADVQTEQQQQQHDYPRVTVTDEEDDPLFEPTALKEENSGLQSEALLIPVDSINEEKEEKEQNQETPAESSNNSTSSPEEKANESNESNEESNDDSNVIFIISSSPWIQRTYRPRFNNLLSGPTFFNHFARPSRPRYSYITPSYGFRRNSYYGSRCGLTPRGFGGFGSFGSFGRGFGSGFGSGLYSFGF